MKTNVKIVFNRLLNGWYVVRGPHQTPISGRFTTKADAQWWLYDRRFKLGVWAQNNRGE